MTEIERLARVVHGAFAQGGEYDFDTEEAFIKDNCRKAVRALLTALREPSREMTEAMADVPLGYDGDGLPSVVWSRTFTAAIDVLLSDGGG